MKKFFRYKIKSKALATVLMLAIPVAALMLMESYTHVPWDLTPPIFILNLVGYYLIYLLGTFLFGGVAGGYTFATLLSVWCVSGLHRLYHGISIRFVQQYQWQIIIILILQEN